jgi:methylated-DNA-[protein]-cysteine S-methyltransferase
MTTRLIETTYDTRALESPVGSLTLVGSEAGLRAILWRADDLARAGLTGAALRPGSNDVLAEAARQLEEYFAGTRTTFDLPLALEGTPFQIAAWEALQAIPYGETRSYAEQAHRIGRPRAVRAIGAANGRNPISIVLPCHRVVGSDGALTGFAGGLEAKAWLLALENARADPTCFRVGQPPVGTLANAENAVLDPA